MYIYESPDEGKHIYRRKIGQNPKDKELLGNDIDEIFMKGIEELAKSSDVTVDYYMYEFM